MSVLRFVHVRDALHVVGSLIGTSTVAWVCYRFYEERFRGPKRRFERAPRRPD